MEKGQIERAEKSQSWLRGQNEQIVNEELSEIVKKSNLRKDQMQTESKLVKPGVGNKMKFHIVKVISWYNNFMYCMFTPDF